MTQTPRRAPLPAVVKRIFERDGWACRYCGATAPLVIDHVQALALGGSDAEDNLQTLCAPCNSKKAVGEKPPQERRILIAFRVNATAVTYLDVLGLEWTGADGARSEVIRCLLAEAMDSEEVTKRARARLLGAHNRLPKGSERY